MSIIEAIESTVLGNALMKTSNTLYRTKEWKELRLSAIEHVGGKCERCGRSEESGSVLQLHHDCYIRGRKPWEYTFSELSVLCQRCHAEIHGQIFATSNWVNLGEPNDLGDLLGQCDFCGTELRFEHHVSHELWGQLTVGTNCADYLTETKEATAQRKLMQRKIRFLNPKKWTSTDPKTTETNRKGFRILVLTKESGVVIEINGCCGKQVYKSEHQAKELIFEKLENGVINEYFKKIKSA